MMRCQRLVLRAVVFGVAAATTAAAQVSQMAGVRTQVPFAVGPFELTTAGTVDRIASPVGARTPFNFDATLALPVRSFGFWVGSGLEGAPEVDSTPQRALLRFGFWQTFRGIRLTVGSAARTARLGGGIDVSSFIRSGLDTVWNDTLDRGKGIRELRPWSQTISRTDTAASSVANWSDLEGRLSWRVGRANFDAVLGSRPAVKSSRIAGDSGRMRADTSHAAAVAATSLPSAIWSRIGINYAFSNRVSVGAAAGYDPSRLALGVPGTRFASISVKLNPWRAPKTDFSAERPTAFVVKPDGVGSYRITYAVPNATSVELSGDFDKWRPVSLVQTRKGVWETTLAIAPGTYHVNVRVNGDKWVAPAGLPQAKDDFNGTVGVLVVR